MPAVPTAPTVGPGVPSTSQLNQFRDAIRFLQTKPIAQLRQTSAQTFTTAVFTPVQFNSEVFDLDPDGVGGHDNSTNNTRWTCRYPGYHLVSGLVTYNGNGTGARHAGLRINGAEVVSSYMSVTPTGADVNGVAPHAMRLLLDVGDYVELVGYQSSGGNLATYVASGAVHSALSIGWDRIQ